MEHILGYLISIVKTKHLPLFLGMLITYRKQAKGSYVDIGEIGDNVPHVFLKF